MRDIGSIVMHHAAAEWTLEQIHKHHRDVNGWDGAGYHFVVHLDGVVRLGRPLGIQGAHAGGANRGSIGVCLSGRFDGDREPPNPAQWDAAIQLVADLCRQYGLDGSAVYGHKEVGTTPTVCPGYDMGRFRREVNVARHRWDAATGGES